MLLGVLLGVLYGQQYIFMILGCWENDCIYNFWGQLHQIEKRRRGLVSD